MGGSTCSHKIEGVGGIAPVQWPTVAWQAPFVISYLSSVSSYLYYTGLNTNLFPLDSLKSEGTL